RRTAGATRPGPARARSPGRSPTPPGPSPGPGAATESGAAPGVWVAGVPPPTGAGDGPAPPARGALAVPRTPVQPDWPALHAGGSFTFSTRPRCAVPSPGTTVKPPATAIGYTTRICSMPVS